MNYELAKKLKDAGFPQGIGGGGVICENGYYDPEFHEALIPFAYNPTLSELIEACGEYISAIYQPEPSIIQWVAEDWREHSGKGKTPEEAVANLWLKINEK